MISPVAFLVTNYRSTELAQKAVCSIRSHEPEATILVVDNDSPLSEVEVEAFIQLGASRVIRNPQNLGYTASLNIGFRELAGTNIVVIHDADAVTTMPMSATLIEKAEQNSDVGIWGFNLIGFNGQPTGNSSLTHTPIELLLGQSLSLRVLNSKYSSLLGKDRILAIHGCAMAVRYEVWHNLGGFDESFSFYGSDIDFCYRSFKELNRRAIVLPELRMIHEGGATASSTSKRVIDWHRSVYLFLTKHQKVNNFQLLLLKLGLLIRHSLEYITATTAYSLIQNSHYHLLMQDKMNSRKILILAILQKKL